MPTPAEKTVAAYFAATRTMNKAAWVQCFAPDGADHDPVNAPPHVGHVALGAFFDSIVGLVKTIGLHEDHVYACGNQIAVKWTGRGLTKSGKPYAIEGIDAFECDEGGKIKVLRAYWDPSKLVAQLE